jgi:glycosyltransferase involved in cell wall biosynthesis
VSDLISIILTTFNRTDALGAALRALARQSDLNFEIVVADDGSGPETARVIQDWTARLPIPIKHVWQEHRGFRGAEIRNRGIVASSGGYCIFLDGDCLARADFIAAHRRLCEPGWFVAGNRVLLSRQLTQDVLAGEAPAETWDFSRLARERLRGGVNRLLPAVHLPLGKLRKIRSNDWENAKTCNLAVSRRDLDRVDGFDASYRGWGREDSDLVVRLLHAGVRRKDGRFATGVLHLWHPAADRSYLPENERRLEQVLASNRAQAMQGLSALREDAKTSSRVSPID